MSFFRPPYDTLTSAALAEVEVNLPSDDSDVFMIDHEGVRHPEPTKQVTLFVFGWHNVEPGPLSWAFPSLRAALDAVRTMRNAAQWSIVSGNDWPGIDEARAQNAVLVEELG